MSTMGLLLLLIFGVFFLAPQDGAEMLISLGAFGLVIAALLSPFLVLKGLGRRSSPKIVVAGGVLGTALPAVVIAGATCLEGPESSYVGIPAVVIVFYLAPIVEVIKSR